MGEDCLLGVGLYSVMRRRSGLHKAAGGRQIVEGSLRKRTGGWVEQWGLGFRV